MLRKKPSASIVESSPALPETALLKAMPVPVYTTDPQGRITFFNDAAESFAGRSPVLGELECFTWRIYRPDGIPLPPDQSPMAITLRERRAVRGIALTAERADGSYLSFMPYPTPLFDEQGKLIGGINVLIEVSDHEHATEQQPALVHSLDHSKHDFELLVRSITDYAIMMLDTNGHVSSWNIGAEKITGYTVDDVMHRHFSCFYISDDRAAGLPQLALDTAIHEGHFESEGWRVRKDGTRFWANVVMDPVQENGQLIGFAHVVRDASRRRASELALIESERRFRGIVNTALDAFAQIDEDGCVTEWNPQAYEMFGWSREQVLGKPLASMCTSHDSYVSKWLISAWHGNVQQQTHQFTATSRSGRSFLAELSVSVLTLSSGRLMNIFARDIAEKVHMEHQLRQSQKMEALGQLTGGIAHDFNNILQAISSSLEVIEIFGERDQFFKAGAHIQNALSCVRRAAALTHRLLAFARRQPLDPQAVDVRALVDGMTELLRRSIGEQITLKLVLPDDLWAAHCDSNQLENAILNVAINARDAMPDGGRLHIEAANVNGEDPDVFGVLDPDGAYVKITVTDSGTGMAPNVKEHAFDPFYTTKPAGHGTGLGLSMVYGFARQSQGHCVIDSELGEGTSISLFLPRYLGPIVPSAELDNAVEAPAAEGEHILLVEDQSVIREAITEVLTKLGYVVTQASDGLEGVSMAMSGESFDLIVSDVGLPGINGHCLADTVRSSRPDLPVLLMTGYDEDVASSGISLPAGMGLLLKPFTVDNLSEHVRKLIQWRHAQVQK